MGFRRHFQRVNNLAKYVPGPHSPATLQRRMRVGPGAEARTIQKIVIVVAFLTLFAMMLFSAFDHRMGWSTVPACGAAG